MDIWQRLRAPPQQVASTCRFGEIEFNIFGERWSVPGSPEIVVVSNLSEDGRPIGVRRAGENWHSDMCYASQAAIRKDVELGDWLPDDVASAMELLRYEKIQRWESKNWFWADDPNYDPSAMRIAEGKKDRHKQDALYVRIGRDGRVCSTPETITEDETSKELRRADRYRFFLRALRSPEECHYVETMTDMKKR